MLCNCVSIGPNTNLTSRLPCLTIHAMVFGRNRCAIQCFFVFSLHERGQHCPLLLYSFLFYFLILFLFCIVFFSDNTLASISFLIDQSFGIMLNLCYAIVLV